MIDGLQHSIGHVFDEAGIENITPQTLVKAWANVAQATMTLDELKDTAERGALAMTEFVDERWEHLEAIRETIADGNEEILRQISQSNIDERVKTVANEGRLGQESIHLLSSTLRADKNRPAQWPEELRLAVDQAMKIRGAEMRTGLLNETTLER